MKRKATIEGTMNLVKKIKKELQMSSKPCPSRGNEFVIRYLGTKRKYLNLKSGERDRILRLFLPEIKTLSQAEIGALLNELFFSDVFEEVNFAGKLLTVLPESRKNIKMNQLAIWIKKTTGWAECDSICQSLMTGSEVQDRWGEWQKSILKFSSDKNTQLRRASLVLECKPNREVSDPRMRKLAFETIEKLKSEKEILITKAISWLLRDLSRQDKVEVCKYLEANKSTLPAIAYREAMRKIKTGKK